MSGIRPGGSGDGIEPILIPEGDEWSLYPAISNVNLDNNNIINGGTITASQFIGTIDLSDSNIFCNNIDVSGESTLRKSVFCKKSVYIGETDASGEMRIFNNDGGGLGVLQINNGEFRVAEWNSTDPIVSIDPSNNKLQVGDNTVFGNSNIKLNGNIGFNCVGDPPTGVYFGVSEDETKRIIIGPSSNPGIPPVASKRPQLYIVAGTSNPVNEPAMLAFLNTTEATEGGLGEANRIEFIGSRSTLTQLYSNIFTTLQNNDIVGSLSFGGDDGTDIRSLAGQIRFVVDGTVSSNNIPGRIEFRTTEEGGSNLNTNMIIRESGNVGIGLTGPSEKLEVNGSIRAINYKTGNVSIGSVNGNLNNNTTLGTLSIGTDNILRQETSPFSQQLASSYQSFDFGGNNSTRYYRWTLGDTSFNFFDPDPPSGDVSIMPVEHTILINRDNNVSGGNLHFWLKDSSGNIDTNWDFVYITPTTKGQGSNFTFSLPPGLNQFYKISVKSIGNKTIEGVVYLVEIT